MTRAILLVILVILLVLIVTGCSDPPRCVKLINPDPEIVTIKNIDRVFMHDPRSFSFLVNGEIIPVNGPTPKFLFDLKSREKPWAQFPRKCDSILTIHLHDPDEINGRIKRS